MFKKGVKWSEVTWNEVKWSEVTWNEAKWSEVTWNEVKWSDVKWSEAKWREMKWSEVKWREMKWSEVKWSDVKWSEAKWREMKWSEVKWSDVKWSEVKWREMKWSEVKWSKWLFVVTVSCISSYVWVLLHIMWLQCFHIRPCIVRSISFVLSYASFISSCYYPFYFWFIVLYVLLSISCVLWSVFPSPDVYCCSLLYGYSVRTSVTEWKPNRSK